jgi:hypothetical protein
MLDLPGRVAGKTGAGIKYGEKFMQRRCCPSGSSTPPAQVRSDRALRRLRA